MHHRDTHNTLWLNCTGIPPATRMDILKGCLLFLGTLTKQILGECTENTIRTSLSPLVGLRPLSTATQNTGWYALHTPELVRPHYCAAVACLQTEPEVWGGSNMHVAALVTRGIGEASGLFWVCILGYVQRHWPATMSLHLTWTCTPQWSPISSRPVWAIRTKIVWSFPNQKPWINADIHHKICECTCTFQTCTKKMQERETYVL